jgi:probable F420-dependent oxidoreductase
MVGVHATLTDRSMPILELAREIEARGLRSLSVPEHTHVPLHSEIMLPGWQIPERYRRTFDPYVSCAWVAATTSLEVGTAVSLIAQHDAIALAKTVATIDHLAGGRFLLGVGFGYSRQEAEDHGFPSRDRYLVVEETIALMRELWTQEVAEFEGRYRRVAPSWSWPKPTRAGGPPILLGSGPSARNFERIVAWADGWIPAGLGVQDPRLETLLADLRSRWEAAGRQGDLDVLCFFHPGSPDAMAREIERAAGLGVQRLQVFLEDESRDDILGILDELVSAVPR